MLSALLCLSCTPPPQQAQNSNIINNPTQCEAIRHQLHTMSVPTAAHRSPYGYGANTIDYAKLMNQYESMHCTSTDNLIYPPEVSIPN